MNQDDSDLLTGWRSPPAPPELKELALAAALNDARRPVRRRLEDRLWESRAVRIGWLAAASLLLALNIVVTNPERAPIVASADQPSRPGDTEIDVGVPIPEPHDAAWTLADAGAVVHQVLTDPCLDPLIQGDCS